MTHAITHEASPSGVVQRQLEAYNLRDLEGFCRCYAPDVVVEAGAGSAETRGLAALRERYARLFAGEPPPRVKVLTRIAVAAWVIDEELVEHESPPRRVVAVFHVSDGLIDRVRFLE